MPRPIPRRCGHRIAVALVLTLLAACSDASDVGGDAKVDETDAAPLDLDDFHLVFAEEFDALDVSAWRETPSRWIAHTPWNGDFGDARFVDPEPGFPFVARDGVLDIEARRDPVSGEWRSGLLSTVDADGGGYRRELGYFEARMRVPEGPGVWPAFWLNSYRPGVPWSGEIDVIEYYGHVPDSYQGAWHLWHLDPATGRSAQVETGLREVPAGAALADGFHDFGVEVRADEIVWYLDRRPVWRIEPPERFRGLAFFPMVNLALGSGWPIDATPDPSRLRVDHVRIYARVDDPVD